MEWTPTQKQVPWFETLFGIVVLTFISAFCYWATDLDRFHLPLRESGYTETAADVQSMRIVRTNKGGTPKIDGIYADIEIVYHYNVDGQRHEGRSGYGIRPYKYEEHAERKLPELQGKAVTCWYVTDRPSMSRQDVQRALIHAHTFWMVTGASSVFGSMGLIVLVRGVRGLWETWRAG